MGASQQLKNFNRGNSDAWQFAWKASDDYLLARFGLLNGLFSGFEMATQATEKLLKSYLLFKDSSLNGKTQNVRREVDQQSRSLGRSRERGHDVEACLTLATNAGLPSSTNLQTRITRINSYYQLRYHDAGGPTSLSTSEVQDIDETIFEIWDTFKSINPDYYYSCGIMLPVYGHLLATHGQREDSISTDQFKIMTMMNKAFEARQSDLEGQIRLRLENWYPKS